MKSGNLNFLELCGPLQACNGTPLLYLYYIIINKRGDVGIKITLRRVRVTIVAVEKQ